MSSGAIMPALAPASIDMLQIVIRPSIERFSIADPRYSITCPVAPAVPIFAMIARMMSFAVTPYPGSPLTVTAIDLATGTKLADLVTGEGAEGIAVTPDGSEVWVTNRAADTISILDPRSLEVRETVACAGFPIRVAMTPDGTRALVSVARAGEVVVFDVETRQELVRRKLDLSTVPDASSRLFGDTFGESPVPVGLVIHPAGDIAWVAATQADAVVVVKTGDLVVKDLLQAGREPDGMSFSPASVGGHSTVGPD